MKCACLAHKTCGYYNNPPSLELDILRKLYYLREVDYLFSHPFSC